MEMKRDFQVEKLYDATGKAFFIGYTNYYFRGSSEHKIIAKQSKSQELVEVKPSTDNVN